MPDLLVLSPAPIIHLAPALTVLPRARFGSSPKELRKKEPPTQVSKKIDIKTNQNTYHQIHQHRIFSLKVFLKVFGAWKLVALLRIQPFAALSAFMVASKVTWAALAHTSLSGALLVPKEPQLKTPPYFSGSSIGSWCSNSGCQHFFVLQPHMQPYLPIRSSGEALQLRARIEERSSIPRGCLTFLWLRFRSAAGWPFTLDDFMKRKGHNKASYNEKNRRIQ